jgi:hypothetical protein
VRLISIQETGGPVDGGILGGKIPLSVDVLSCQLGILTDIGALISGAGGGGVVEDAAAKSQRISKLPAS